MYVDQAMNRRRQDTAGEESEAAVLKFTSGTPGSGFTVGTPTRRLKVAGYSDRDYSISSRLGMRQKDEKFGTNESIGK